MRKEKWRHRRWVCRNPVGRCSERSPVGGEDERCDKARGRMRGEVWGEVRGEFGYVREENRRREDM